MCGFPDYKNSFLFDKYLIIFISQLKFLTALFYITEDASFLRYVLKSILGTAINL